MLDLVVVGLRGDLPQDEPDLGQHVLVRPGGDVRRPLQRNAERIGQGHPRLIGLRDVHLLHPADRQHHHMPGDRPTVQDPGHPQGAAERVGIPTDLAEQVGQVTGPPFVDLHREPSRRRRESQVAAAVQQPRHLRAGDR